MSESRSKHFLNGKLVEESDLVVSVRDLGFTRGYAVFDFFVTYNRRPFMLVAHLDRLFHSAQVIGLALPWSKEQIHEWVLEALAANDDGKEKAIKVIVSGGVSSSMLPTDQPTIAIVVDDRHTLSKEQYEKGIGLITVKHTRYDPEAKTNNYIEGVKQTKIANAQNAVEPLYYDSRQVFETSNSNIFALIDGTLVTPGSNMLNGITRSVLLKILRLDVPVKVADFSIDELRKAAEVFITGSAKEIVPVTTIDGIHVGDGSVGEVTKEVMKQYQRFISSNDW